MSSMLLNELNNLLTGLEQTQGELETLLSGKTEALANLRTGDLLEISRREEQLSLQLQRVLAQRTKLLQQARSAGVPATSLLQLAGVIGKEVRGRLQERIQSARRQAERIRRNNWTHWIIAHRCYSHYTELLELVAQRGEPAPTYTPGKPASYTGGVVLDASA